MVVAFLLGFSWQMALIVGLALAMSSTAIAMQSVAQRSITKTDTAGQLAILLVQAVILRPHPGARGDRRNAVERWPRARSMWPRSDEPRGWLVASYRAACRGPARQPLRHPPADAVCGPYECARGLYRAGAAPGDRRGDGNQYVIAGAWCISGGVLLADSEYRHELESNLEPFKGCCSACSSFRWALRCILGADRGSAAGPSCRRLVGIKMG
jgi:glutathione-regulated potassium-efflux system ancillary protein KefC